MFHIDSGLIRSDINMFLLISVAVCLLGATLHEAEAAGCHLREMDLCLATVMISATEGVPADEEDIDRACEPVQEGIDCMGNYSESCFTPLMKEAFDMLMAEPKKYQALMCTHGTEERARYLKNAPCFEKTMAGDNVKTLMEDFKTALETATEVHFQKRIPCMCCGIQRLFKDMSGLIEKECGKGILDEGGMVVGLPVSSMSNIFCSGYDPSSPKCAGILPPSGTPSKGLETKLQLFQWLNTFISNLN